MDNGLAVTYPGCFERGATRKDCDHIGIDGRNGFEEVDLVGMDLEVLAVQAFGFTQLVQAKVHQDHFRLSGQCHSRFNARLVLATISQVTGRITDHL